MNEEITAWIQENLRMEILLTFAFFVFGVYGVAAAGYIISSNYLKIGHYFGIITAVWIEDLEDGNIILSIVKKHPDGGDYVVIPYERIIKLKENGKCESKYYHDYKWIEYKGPKL